MKKYFICLLSIIIFFSVNVDAQLVNKQGRKMISKVTINTNLGNRYNTTTISFTYNSERELVGIYFLHVHPSKIVGNYSMVYKREGNNITCKYYKNGKPYIYSYVLITDKNGRLTSFIQYGNEGGGVISRYEMTLEYKNGVLCQFMKHFSTKTGNEKWEPMPSRTGYEFFCENCNYNYVRKDISYADGITNYYAFKRGFPLQYTNELNDINVGIEHLANYRDYDEATYSNSFLLYTEWVGVISKNKALGIGPSHLDKYTYTYDNNGNIKSIDAYKGEKHKRHVEVEYVYG